MLSGAVILTFAEHPITDGKGTAQLGLPAHGHSCATRRSHWHAQGGRLPRWRDQGQDVTAKNNFLEPVLLGNVGLFSLLNMRGNVFTSHRQLDMLHEWSPEFPPRPRRQHSYTIRSEALAILSRPIEDNAQVLQQYIQHPSALSSTLMERSQ
jgi:hypothetical protein